MNILISQTAANNKRTRVELYKEIADGGNTLFFLNAELTESFQNPDGSIELPISNTVERNNDNPFKELRIMMEERAVLKKNQIDGVLVYGIKTISRFVLSAKLAGVRRVVCVVNGAGNLFMENGMKRNLLRVMAYPMLWLAFHLADRVLFQNPDDCQLMQDKHLVKAKKIGLTNGSGVNLEEYRPEPLPMEPAFLLISRITGSKGINEYLEAAKIVKSKYPAARIDLVGPNDDKDNSVNWEELLALNKSNVIHYHGPTDDVKDFLRNAGVFVFPSYYREGVPRSSLEAMAMGRALITTDMPGCKETVQDGVNGFVVKPRDAEDLAKKMLCFIEEPDLCRRMGAQSRKLAEDKFNIYDVNKTVIEALGI